MEDFRRLVTAVSRARDRQRWVRRTRRKMLSEYVGAHYGGGPGGEQGPAEGDARKRETLSNLLQLTADVYTQRLVGQRPRVLVTSLSGQNPAFAHRYQFAVNETFRRNHVDDELRLAVLDAFFSFGIVKTVLASGQQVEFAGEWIDVGRPTVRRISPDDFFWDPDARAMNEVRFCGDIYTTPRQALYDAGYDPGLVAAIPTFDAPRSEDDDDERAETLSGDQRTKTDDRYVELVRIADCWLPDAGVIVTFAWSANSETQPAGEPLAVVPWEGPETGPYQILGYGAVPDNFKPLAPAENLYDLHALANSLMRKLAVQARRQKQNLVFEPGEEDDAERLRKADDGEAIKSRRPESAKWLAAPGADAKTAALVLQLQDLYSRQAGNLDAMAGLGPQAETLGQDRLIHSAVSAREAEMQQRVVDFVGRVARTVGWLLWEDTFTYLEGMLTLEGTSLTYPIEWDAERVGRFVDYEFAVDPYSLPYVSPSDRVERMLGLLERVYLPLAPVMQQQGGFIDIEQLTVILSDMTGEPRLRDVIRFAEPMVDPSAGIGQPPPGMSPSSTTRNYVRRNVPTGGTDSSRRTTMAQALLAGSANDDQMAALTRSGA